LTHITNSLNNILTIHSLTGQIKTAILEVLEIVKRAAEEKVTAIHVPLNTVKTLHEHFKADLLV
jgi:hypothetical protein